MKRFRVFNFFLGGVVRNPNRNFVTDFRPSSEMKIPTRMFLPYRSYSDDEGFLSMFGRILKEKMEEDAEIQEEKDKIKRTLTAQALQSGSDQIKKSSEYVSEQTEDVRKEMKKGAEKAIDKIYDGVDALGKGIDAVSEQKVVKTLIDELNRESQILREAHYTFRSTYARKQDEKRGVYYNPYTKKFEESDKVEVDSETTALNVNPSNEGEEEEIKKKGGIFEQMAEKLVGQTDSSEAMTIIKKRDEKFQIDLFMGNLEHILIPTVFEAYFKDQKKKVRRFITTPCYKSQVWPLIEERVQSGHKFDTKIISVEETDYLGASFTKMGEPHLYFLSVLQYIHCIRDEEGNIVEGGPSDVRRLPVHYGMGQDSSHETLDWEIVEITFRFTLKLTA